MTDTDLPLVDLAIQHRLVADEVERGWASVVARGAFVLGDEVGEFEGGYAAFSRSAHCIGLANGTDALELALRAAGVEPGDEVVLPANTFVATAEAVVRTGAQVVLADCDDRFLLIDPADVERRVTERTKVIVPVHLYGQMAPMPAIDEIARRTGLVVIEDAAQAQGADQSGRPPAATSLAAATSFYPGKNLGAYGDAGAVVTNDADLAIRIRQLANHGLDDRAEHAVVGWNSRLDTLQAVVLSAKLAFLDDGNRQRAAAADRYGELLRDVEAVGTPATAPGNHHAWHLYVVRVAERDRVLTDLRAAGIAAGVHYRRPIHLQPAFEFLGLRAGSLPVAEGAAPELLSLPLFPGITAQQQERVVDSLRKAVSASVG
jgi:dTDP-4-amino-4,6-dideoxygalactose transaminase